MTEQLETASSPSLTQLLTIDNSWKRELASAFKDPLTLLEYLQIKPTSKSKTAGLPLLSKFDFPMLVPQYFADLIEKGNIDDPILLQVLPFASEQITHPDFVLQPLDEQDNFIPVANIVHKYADRLLFLPKGACAVNCRYCFRRNFPYAELEGGKEQWQASLEYAFIQNITELILSGGDPLMMTDKEFAWLGEQVLAFNARQKAQGKAPIDRIRIHSRLPVVLPNRITQDFITLCQALIAQEVQVILVTHINHGNEVSALLKAKLHLLAQASLTLLNQSVLLKGVNDNPEVLAELSHKLFKARVLPYYLHLLDKVTGATYFYVPDERALEIYAQLQKLTSGYLVPKLAREIVGEPHKTLYTTGCN
ncbi:EF-P beta-lysylation protein EpmB [Psittacicella hinzii]|uniref:L-lysine 2,3-aminomutase n=1 Tax=Psittacicella hinzii TaxID=2028575 RepID=A0A3A1YG19_9GAMM|nr:EF-P beta-lysylation protein EpmB [Psittacicella hinzii]RIY37082.1 EF-P beta-lysylation protein EpmB [Psittacicella hinzii]